MTGDEDPFVSALLLWQTRTYTRGSLRFSPPARPHLLFHCGDSICYTDALLLLLLLLLLLHDVLLSWRRGAVAAAAVAVAPGLHAGDAWARRDGLGSGGAAAAVAYFWCAL